MYVVFISHINIQLESLIMARYNQKSTSWTFIIKLWIIHSSTTNFYGNLAGLWFCLKLYSNVIDSSGVHFQLCSTGKQI